MVKMSFIVPIFRGGFNKKIRFVYFINANILNFDFWYILGVQVLLYLTQIFFSYMDLYTDPDHVNGFINIF